MSQFASEHLLLACLRAELGENEAWADRLTDEDWQALVQTALAQQVAPLLYRRLAPLRKAGRVPAAVVETTRLIYMEATKANALLYRESTQVLQALTRQGIAVIALKGIHLAELIYASRTQRMMADVDILVKKDDLQQVDDILRRMGYGYSESSAFNPAREQHWPALTRPGGVTVETHWTISPPAGAAKVDVAGLWQRAQPAVIAGVDVLTLCPEDFLLSLCLHAAIHHRFNSGIRPLIDVGEVVRHLGDRLDWPVVGRRAREWRAARAVHLTLHLAQEMLAAPVPAWFLDEFRPPDFDERLVAAAEDKMFRQSAVLSTNFMQLWRPARARDKLGLLLASLFPPRAVMAELYPIRPGSARLGYYYLVRLKDLVLRYGQAALQRWRGDAGTVSRMERDAVLREHDRALREWLASG